MLANVHRSGWSGFALWGGVGALLAFALVTLPSIGLFVLPIAILAAFLTAYYLRSELELLGLLTGAAAISLLIGLLNLDYRPCPPGGFSLAPGDTRVESCGGFNPLPWFVAAGGLAAASVAGYTIGKRRRGRP